MLTWFLIYLFVMIESITALFSGYVGMISGGVAIYAIMAILSAIAAHEASCYHNYTKEQESFSWWWDNHKTIGKFKKLGKWLLSLGIVFMILTHLIPSQKNLAIIVGSGVTYELITSDTGKRIGGKAIELLEKKVDEALKSDEAKPEEKPKSEAKKSEA